MMTPQSGIFVAGLYFAFTVILWVALNPNVRRRLTASRPNGESGSASQAHSPGDPDPALAAPTPETAPGTDDGASQTADRAAGEPVAPVSPASAHQLLPIAERLGTTMFFFWLAVAAHLVFTVLDLSRSFPDASIAKAFSLTSLMMVASLLALCARYQLHILLLFFAPLAGVAVFISSVSQSDPNPFSAAPLVYWHLTIALVAACTCLLTAPLALVAQIINQQLRTGDNSGWFGHLPPLASIERLIINLLVAATLLLIIASAIIIPEIIDARVPGLAHKIFFTVIALALLFVLLSGHWLYGWRGKLLVRMVYAANICLVLAYFGTKAVLELILRI